jgi:hypothetical protein
MAAPISLRGDFDGPMPWGLFWRERSGASPAACYLSSLFDGGPRANAARPGGVGLHRDCILRFSFRGPDGLVDCNSTGHPSKLMSSKGTRSSLWSRPVGSRRSMGPALDDDRSRAMGVR